MTSSIDSAPVEPLAESYPAVADSVSRARRALARLAAACGAAADEIDSIRLAMSEAMTNAVLHGNGSDDQIRVRAAVIEDTLAVTIDDDQQRLLAFPPCRPGLGPGIGLALIAHAADELAIAKRAAGGIEVRMRFGLGLGGISPQT